LRIIQKGTALETQRSERSRYGMAAKVNARRCVGCALLGNEASGSVTEPKGRVRISSGFARRRVELKREGNARSSTAQSRKRKDGVVSIRKREA
jgi:hypothetical protein